MTAQRIIQPIRGEIYLVNFDPTIGSEISKTRPALIIQNNIANENSPMLNQIRSIDRQRLIRRIGAIGSAKMNEVDRAIQISFGLLDL
jgi:mRNA interferase MazF